jgi:integrase
MLVRWGGSDMARRTLTDKGVAALRPRARVFDFPDPELPGHFIKVQPTGSKAYYVAPRGPDGKQKWVKVGDASLMDVDSAREKARDAINAVRAGQSATPDSFSSVAENWFKRYVIEKKKLRTAPEIRRYLDKHILPEWGNREFVSIRRDGVNKLLDKIVDNVGPVAADKVLAYLSKLFRWYATQREDYTTPIVPGMGRSDPRGRARDRILSDDELRSVWKAASENGTFGAFVRLLLLTGQRREKVAAMRWQDIAIDGTWTIPAEDREKGNALELKLPDAALDIIKAQPRFESNPYVFAGRGGSHYSGYSKGKAALDAKAPMPEWRLHDLRRTARSLMSRAGVRPDIAERVLGHAIQGVEGVYDRHSYREEKAHALQALAGLIESILAPEDQKVRRLRA